MAKAKATNKRKPLISLVSQVEKTGLEVVKSKPTRGKLASAADYAKMQFKPWIREPDMRPDELRPTDECMRNNGCHARMAYGVMLRSKEQLMESFGSSDGPELFDVMLAGIALSRDRTQ